MERLERSTTSVIVHQLFRMRQNMLTTIIQLISVMRLSMLIVPIFASQAMYAGGWKKKL